jgi:3-phenylpropionate/cinnamic acid dioxygenase small subunit
MASIVEEKDAIRELLARYCFHFDSGEFDEWVNLFTEDAVFDVGARGRFAGREALRNFVRVIPLTNGVPGIKHCVMNSIVNVEGDRATARSYVVVVQGGEVLSVPVAGRYEDELVKAGGQWRFTNRKVHLDLMGGGLPGA